MTNHCPHYLVDACHSMWPKGLSRCLNVARRLKCLETPDINKKDFIVKKTSVRRAFKSLIPSQPFFIA